MKSTRAALPGALVGGLLGLGCTVGDAPAPLPNRIAEPALLVISPDALTAELDRLADWRRRTGLPTEVVPLSVALGGGEGPDEAARLRDYLRRRWQESAVEQVLLGGDTAVMPVRQIPLEVDIETEGIWEEAVVASDLYFADLDGDWDADGDGEIGEIGEPTDFLPDVALGRVPVETAEEARAYVDKLLAYEHSPAGPSFDTGYESRVLLSAGIASLGFYGSAGVEGYVKPGLPEHLELTRLYSDYEQRPGALDYTAEGFLAALAAGQSIAFNMGHGAETTMGPLGSNAQVDSIDNAACPSIYVTCECLGGRFDYADTDSSGEHFVLGPTGGVAYLGSTNLGVGYPSIALIMQQLVRALYDETATGLPDSRLGPAMQWALRSYVIRPEALHTLGHPDRWSQLVWVMLGDPAIRVWTDTARLVTVEVTDQQDCEWATLQVTSGGAPVAGATVTAYVPGELLLIGHTGASGEVALASGGCTLTGATVTVTGANVIPATLTL